MAAPAGTPSRRARSAVNCSESSRFSRSRRSRRSRMLARSGVWAPARKGHARTARPHSLLSGRIEYLLQFTAHLKGRVRLGKERADAKLGDTIGSVRIRVRAHHYDGSRVEL